MSVIGWAIGALALGTGGLVAFTERTRRRVEAASPPRGRFVEVASHRLHVVEAGEGPTVLLVHGLGGQIGHYHALMPELAKDHRVIAIDRPGSGHSVRPKGSAAGPLAQADVIAALIETLDLDRPLVIGHSLGGAVAMALALEHPQLVRGVALICPVLHEPKIIHPMFRPLIVRSDTARRAIGWTVATPASMLRGQHGVTQAFAPDPPPPGFAHDADGLLGLRPSVFRNASMDIVSLPDDLERMAPRYTELRVPAAILYGRGDQLLDPDEQGRRTHAEAPDIAYEEIEGGHMILISRPVEVADWVRRCEATWGTAAARELHASPH